MQERIVSSAERRTFIGLLSLLIIVVYGASIGNDFVRWDDGLLIYENPAIFTSMLSVMQI